MPSQPLQSDVRCCCNFTPIYVDMDGNLYAGEPTIVPLDDIIPDTNVPGSSSACTPSHTVPSTDNADNAHSAARAGKPNASKEKAVRLKGHFSYPAAARGILADVAASSHISTAVGLAGLVLLPVPITLDYAGGRNACHATVANVSGFAAGYGMSKLTVVILRNLPRVRFAASAAMLGGRAGKFAGALIGFVAGMVMYNYVSDEAYKILEGDSEDRSHVVYDDFLDYP